MEKEKLLFRTDHTIYHRTHQHGYVFNINNPVVHYFYKLYLKEKNIPEHIGLTDDQRKNFESEIQYKINKGEIIVRRECGSYVRKKRSRSE